MPIVARDIMETDVITVRPTTSVTDLEDLLIDQRVGGVPVVDRGQLIGIISRSDVVRVLSLERSLAGVASQGIPQNEFAPDEAPDSTTLVRGAGRDLGQRTVRDIMVVDVVTVSPETPLAELARLLVDRHLHRVVVTEGKTVRGVISALDVVQLVADGRLAER